jgi:cation diffusion facilitator CzcD-associated flavoprotein CzcO
LVGSRPDGIKSAYKKPDRTADNFPTALMRRINQGFEPMTSVTPTFAADDALDQLTRQVQAEIALLAYPNREWVRPVSHPSGAHVYDVVVIGGGQAGMATAFALRREGVNNILILDAQPAGMEGVWETFARMPRLRTPKATVGIESGIPSLSAPSFYKARYGLEAWNEIDRIERPRWMEFLRWFRQATGLHIQNRTRCLALGPASAPDGGLVALSTRNEESGSEQTVLARHVVLATGYDGCGAWGIPKHITAAVPPERVCHANGPIDFAPLAGKRIGLLGHGASAFDNACALLDAGVASVDLCFRREKIPTINPHRCVEFTGFLKHFFEMDDLTRWRVGRYFEVYAEPPTQNGYDRAHSFANFRMHTGSPWVALQDRGDTVQVRTPKTSFTFDYLVCATGAVVDYEVRDELRALGPLVQRWRHRFAPPDGESSEVLGEYPYLGPGFQYMPLTPAHDQWVRRVRAFNFSSVVSMGPHTTSSSGHKYAVPRLVAGLTAALMEEQTDAVMPTLFNYDQHELDPAAPERTSRAA